MFVAILTSVLWTMGLYTLLGFSYNVLSSILPALIVVLAVADDVHIVQHFDHEYRLSGDYQQAFTSSVEHLFAPLLGASVTTALGMLSLATSDIAAVREFGIGASIGVMVDFVLSLVLRADVDGPGAGPAIGAAAGTMADRPVTGRRAVLDTPVGAVLAVVAVLAAIALAGVTRLRVDTNHINFFADTHPLHQSAVLIDSQLAGIYSFQVMLEGPADSLKSPDTLARIERLEGQLRTLPSVRKVTSHADYIKRVNRQLHGDRPEAEVIPPSAEAIAQELFLFGLSDDGRAELERVVSSDFSRAQITVKMASHSSDLVFQEIGQAGTMAAEAFDGSDVRTNTTGSGRLFSTLDHYMVVSQLSSFGTAFLTVFGVIFLVFRSARFGMLAIVANTFPVLVILGFMGWLGITLNIATIMVASVTLGVVDDDTIHFINRYRREAAGGASTEDAIETATIHEGRASLTTAIINTLAYGILGFSSYKPTAWFGGLLALIDGCGLPRRSLHRPGRDHAGAPRLRDRAGAGGGMRRAALGLAAALAATSPLAAQAPVTGYVSMLLDVVGRPATGGGGRDADVEWRPRAFLEYRRDVGDHVRLRLSGYVEGLVADRHQAESPTTDLIARPQELYVEFVSERADLRLGYSRIVWGRLDELQPTDVVNPLDLAKFFFEGRAEARIPVAMARAALPAGIDDARGRGRAAVPARAVRPAGRADLGVQPACRHLAAGY